MPECPDPDTDENSKVTCPDCGKKYVSAVNMRRHQQVHQEPQVCQCGATFSTKEALKEHENAKHKRLYVCKECPVWRQFLSRSGLFAHQLLLHKTGSRLECKICGRRFGQAGHLKDHMNVHSDEATCICDTCGKKFKFRYSLRKHMKICTGDNVRRGRPRTRSTATTTSAVDGTPGEVMNQDPTTCYMCGKGFTNNVYLKQHLQKHRTEMRLCPTCGKSFKFKSSLCRHIKSCSAKERSLSIRSEDVSEEATLSIGAIEDADGDTTYLSSPSEDNDVQSGNEVSNVEGGNTEVVCDSGTQSGSIIHIVGGPSDSVTVLSGPAIESSGDSITVLSGPTVETSGDTLTVLSGPGIETSGDMVVLSGPAVETSGDLVTVLSGPAVETGGDTVTVLSGPTIETSGVAEYTAVLSVASDLTKMN